MTGLRALRDRIMAESPSEVWFWPAWNGVSGWDGDENIIFLSVNPTFGTFPGTGDQLLYRSLAQNGLGRAHLSSLIKERAEFAKGNALFADLDTVARSQEFLNEEIRLLQPKVIVALGPRAERYLSDWKPALELRDARLYATVSPWSKSNWKFPEQVLEVREIHRGTGGIAELQGSPMKPLLGRPEKDAGLQRLRERMVQELLFERARQVWFWPDYEGVRGWSGTADILITGSYPSAQLFPDETDRSFYRLADSLGLAEAHLTDLLKTSAKDRQTLERLLSDPNLMALQRGYFEEEIRVLEPAIIIVTGKSTAKTIFEQWQPHLGVDGIPVCYIPHFKAASYGGNVSDEQFTTGLRECLAAYWKLKDLEDSFSG